MMELDYFPSEELHGATVSSKKRRLREPLEWPSPAKSLPFLRWNKKQPDEDDDDNKGNIVPRACSTSFDPTKKKLVGWPPIKRWRKKSKCKSRFNRTVENGCVTCRGTTPYHPTIMD